MKPRPKPLSLGDIARYCHVDRVTVQRWVKTSFMPSYRTPGGHYRVHKEDFLEFLKKGEMPIYPEFFQDIIKRILIADSAEDANLLAGYLSGEESNYEVKVCTSGTEALISLGQFQPDLLILNARMEGLSTEIFQQIRESMPQDLRILALSDESDSPEELLNAGADQVVKKPVEQASFLAAMRTDF